jgi:hypothetical protein
VYKPGTGALWLKSLYHPRAGAERLFVPSIASWGQARREVCLLVLLLLGPIGAGGQVLGLRETDVGARLVVRENHDTA